MATATGVSRADTPVFTSAIIWLLAILVLINYVDRGSLSTAGPLIRDELKLTNGQLGILLSAFFWTYVPFHPIAGWFAEKFNAYQVLAIALTIWAGATAMTGLAHSFAFVLTLRLLLGVGESAAFPLSSKLFGQHLKPDRMGFANGLVGVGIALGPAFGVFFGGEIMAQAGWRLTFILFGCVSLLWLFPWLISSRKLSQEASTVRPLEAEPSFSEIMAKPAFWGTTLGHGLWLYAFYFVISWLPTYLVKAQGLSVRQMAVTGGEIYLLYAVSSLLTGWATDRLIKAGVSATWSRKTFLVISPLVICAAMAGAALGDAKVAIASLFVAGAAFGLETPNIYATAQGLAGPRASGKWVGLMNGIANTTGIAAPLATGFIVDATGSFYAAFAAAGVTSILTSIVVFFLIWRIEETKWSGQAAP